MLTSKKILSLIFCLLIFFSCINQVWSRSEKKQLVMAVLTFNIVSFTRWSEQTFINENNTINLCVFGDNIVQQAFENIDNKAIHSKTIHVINLLKLSNLNRCQVLYLSGLDQNRLLPLLVEMKGRPVLTVGENIEFLQSGGMVGLDNKKGKIKLNINLSIVKQSGLTINSRLLNLANIVDFPVVVQ